jgi:hypothetical protein
VSTCARRLQSGLQGDRHGGRHDRSFEGARSRRRPLPESVQIGRRARRETAIAIGTIIEYASTCSIPIVHGPGDTSIGTQTAEHWWRNETKEPVELYSAYLFPESMMHTGEEPKI